MTEKVNDGLSPVDSAIELMTSSRSVSGGRAAALQLLGELRAQWGRETANAQMTAHDSARPYYHGGQPCHSGFDCHVRKIIELAEPDARQGGAS